MSHYRNRRSFASRTARGFMRLNKFSSADKPAPVELASAGTTGSAEGSIPGQSALQANADALVGESAEVTDLNGTVDRDLGVTDAPHVAPQQCGETAGAPSSAATDNGASAGSSPEQRGSHEVTSKPDQQRPTPLSDHSAGGGVCCAMLAAQVHADRWATLAVIAIFICAFAIAAIRANRSSRPTTPPRGPFAGSDPRNNRS